MEELYPDVLVCKAAARYCGVTPGRLRQVARAGEIRFGRRGGRGTLTFRREDLNRWLLGEVPDEGNESLSRGPSKAKNKGKDCAAALQRIAAIAAEGQ